MAKKAARETLAMFIDCVGSTLDRVSGDDENLDHIQYVCEDLDKVDTSAIDVDAVLNNRKVQAAFKRFITAQLGTFRSVGEDRSLEGEDE